MQINTSDLKKNISPQSMSLSICDEPSLFQIIGSNMGSINQQKTQVRRPINDNHSEQSQVKYSFQKPQQIITEPLPHSRNINISIDKTSAAQEILPNNIPNSDKPIKIEENLIEENHNTPLINSANMTIKNQGLLESDRKEYHNSKIEPKESKKFIIRDLASSFNKKKSKLKKKKTLPKLIAWVKSNQISPSNIVYVTWKTFLQAMIIIILSANIYLSQRDEFVLTNKYLYSIFFTLLLFDTLINLKTFRFPFFFEALIVIIGDAISFLSLIILSKTEQDIQNILLYFQILKLYNFPENLRNSKLYGNLICPQVMIRWVQKLMKVLLLQHYLICFINFIEPNSYSYSRNCINILNFNWMVVTGNEEVNQWTGLLILEFWIFFILCMTSSDFLQFTVNIFSDELVSEKEDKLLRYYIMILIERHLKQLGVNSGVLFKLCKQFPVRDDIESSALFESMSESIRNSVKQEIYICQLRKIPIFGELSDGSLKQMARHMKDNLKDCNEVVSGGGNERRLLLLLTGKFEIHCKNLIQNHKISIFEAPCIYGQEQFFLNKQDHFELVALETCSYGSIGYDECVNIIKMFPRDFEIFKMKLDQLAYNDESQLLRQFCLVCKESSHLLENCSAIHQLFDKDQVFQMLNWNSCHERSEFYRMKTRKQRINLHEIQEAAMTICDDDQPFGQDSKDQRPENLTSDYSNQSPTLQNQRVNSRKFSSFEAQVNQQNDDDQSDVVEEPDKFSIISNVPYLNQASNFSSSVYQLLNRENSSMKYLLSKYPGSGSGDKDKDKDQTNKPLDDTSKLSEYSLKKAYQDSYYLNQKRMAQQFPNQQLPPQFISQASNNSDYIRVLHDSEINSEKQLGARLTRQRTRSTKKSQMQERKKSVNFANNNLLPQTPQNQKQQKQLSNFEKLKRNFFKQVSCLTDRDKVSQRQSKSSFMARRTLSRQSSSRTNISELTKNELLINFDIIQSYQDYFTDYNIDNILISFSKFQQKAIAKQKQEEQLRIQQHKQWLIT